MNPLPENDPSVRALVALALDEDHVRDDVTSRLVVPRETRATARLVAKEPGTLAGAFLLDAGAPLRAAFPSIDLELLLRDGAALEHGDLVARLEGPAHDVLAIERTLLNFLQRLSGIATETARYVAAVAGTGARIQETRKTCPGWRVLDKFAVRVGGGLNHRAGLHDQVLIKENHLAALRIEGSATPERRIAAAVRLARAGAPAGMLVEIEVEDLRQFEAALDAAPDIIMLDEFEDADIARAVARRNERGAAPLLEVSGGIRLERARALASLGVDRLSVGALTHSVRALDLALKIVTRPDAA